MSHHLFWETGFVLLFVINNAQCIIWVIAYAFKEMEMHKDAVQ